MYPIMMGASNMEGVNYAEMMKQPMNVGWIQWFLSLEDHDLLLEVETEFIKDKMNLIDIKRNFGSKERYKECLKLLLSHKIPTEEDLQNQKFLELN